MKNINLLKNLAVLSLLVLPTLSYSATQPAISISRANCYAPFPNMGDLNGAGYYNESFSYDRLFKTHSVRVITTQTSNATGSGSKRTKIFPSGQFVYTNTWRGYAGFTDKILYNWKVSGKHEELLDSGQYILKNTSATTCNITQW